MKRLCLLIVLSIFSIAIWAQYEKSGYDYDTGLTRVMKNGKYGYIDRSGNEVIPCIYEDGHDFQYNLHTTAVKKNGKWGIVDKSGKVITNFVYDKIGKWERCGNTWLAECQRGDADNNCIDTNGVERLPKHSWLFRYEIRKEGYILVWEFDGDKAYTYDLLGKMIAPSSQFDWFGGYYQEGLAAFRKNDKIGFVDEKLNIIIPAQYDEVLAYCNGMAAVKKDGKWGFIDKSGQCVIPFQYNSIGCYTFGALPFFNHCTASVCLNGKYGLIDVKGNVLTGFIYDEILYSKGKDYDLPAKRDGKLYSLDLKGREHEFSTSDFADFQVETYMESVNSHDDFFLEDLGHYYWRKGNTLKAFDCFFRAANSDKMPIEKKARSQYFLALFYTKDELRNLNQAMYWLRQAADLGYESAIHELVKLENDTSNKQ